MTICQEQDPNFQTGARCSTKMIFSLERRIWYCPECGNCVRVPVEQQSLNEYTRKS